MNDRVSPVNGQRYAIKFNLRMPSSSAWNGRFFMMGGGGTNGALGDARGPLPGAGQTENALSRGFAVVSTDSGHDNATNNDPNDGGTGSFGRDPQARRDYYFDSYDHVTQAGKLLVQRFYGKTAQRSYFVGCSEGGREALLMAERYPTYYDGVISGAPNLSAIRSSTPQNLQDLAKLARDSGIPDSNGLPSIHKTYSDADIQLVSSAVLKACDALDGLKDGMVGHPQACTAALVRPELDRLICSGAKGTNCLTAQQVATLSEIMAGTFNSRGQRIAWEWSWDAGIGGSANGAVNQGWRSWFLGAFGGAVSNSLKLFSSNLAYVAVTPPPVLKVTEIPNWWLNYDYRSLSADPVVNYPASGIYTDAPGVIFTAYGAGDEFRNRGGKILAYHGLSDPAIPFAGTVKWFEQTQAKTNAQDFVRFYPVPGMNHCVGGPATDKFEMLTPLVDWVEKGIAPNAITAEASNPAYFAAPNRSRPLCPFPAVPTYNGTGNVDSAASFSCR
ncbi:feruloyl esterase [Variovorax boronicumulans]|nr:feruloyl esterase [Variovorax boronicumulans]MDQ0007813.1 feruloyl esterase [Variovorax boronicumulans]MDQ0044342.1 feruloyl esterase [Variovorax boronicumulans]